MLMGKNPPGKIGLNRHVQAELNTAGFFFLAHRPPQKKFEERKGKACTLLQQGTKQPCRQQIQLQEDETYR